MKRLWWAAAILLCLLLAAGYNAGYLAVLTEDISAQLEQAEALGESGDWARAAAVTRQAQRAWEEHELYLHVTLPHAAIDEIRLTFQQALEFLENRESGEYAASNARLMGALALLREQEALTLKNLL